MAALFCVDTAAGSLRIPHRCILPRNAVLTAPVAALRHNLPARGLRCAGTDVRATEKPDSLAPSAVKEAEALPLPPFEQSLVAAGSVSDEAAANKFGFKEASTYVIYGTGAFFAGWILSALASGIESIPLLPRILELVGLGYTVWFFSRYLLFKENRDELFAKAYDLKLKIIGPGDA